MILANPVSSSPASGVGPAGQAAGAATGAGLMAGTAAGSVTTGTPSMFALDLGAVTAGTRAMSGVEASLQGAGRGMGGRGGIPLTGLRELHLDASMLVQFETGAGLPAAIAPGGWIAGAARTDSGAGVAAGGLAGGPTGEPAGEATAAQPTAELALGGGAADAMLDAAVALPGMPTGILSGMIATGGQASTVLDNTFAGTAFSTALSAQATAGSTDGPTGGTAKAGAAASGSGTAATGGAAPATGMAAGPDGAPFGNGDGEGSRPASASMSLPVNTAGAMAAGLALNAAVGLDAETGSGTTGAGISPAGAGGAGPAGGGGSPEILSTVVPASGGDVAGDAGMSPEAMQRAILSGESAGRDVGQKFSQNSGQGGSATIAATSVPEPATAALAPMAATTRAPETGTSGSAVTGNDAGEAATGTASGAAAPQQGRDVLNQATASQVAAMQSAGRQAGGEPLPGMAADEDAGTLPGQSGHAGGTVPGKSDADRDVAGDPTRQPARPETTATTRVTTAPATDAMAAGKLSVSGTAPASGFAGTVIPAGDVDASITISTVANGADGVGATGTGSREQGRPAAGGQAMPALTGQVANVLPRGAASAAARASELDYAQAVEQATTGTPGQDGEGAGAAREGSSKPATATATPGAGALPLDIQRPGVSAAALAFAAAMADGDSPQGEEGDPFNGLTEIARAEAQASVSTAALRGSTAALPQNAAVASAHLAAEVARFAQKGQTRFQIRMDPPELGRVDVELKVSRDGTVRAHLAVERSETLDMFLRDQRGLERALDAAGLKLESGGLEMSLKNQDGSAAFDRGEGGDSRSSQPGEGGVLQKEDGDTLPTAAARAYVSGASGALDIQI